MASFHSLRSLLLALVLLSLDLLGLQAVERAAEPAGVVDEERLFSDSVEVAVANIQVMVTDRHGRPVDGLTREDFEIFENGQQQTLSNFFAVEAGEADEPDRESPEYLEATAVDHKIQRGNVIIFVDNYNIRPENRKRLFASLRQHVQHAADTGVQFMVASLGRELTIDLPLTDDRLHLMDVLDELEQRENLHAILDADRRMFLSRLQSVTLHDQRPQSKGGASGVPDFDAAIRTARELAETIRPIAERRYQKVKTTLEALGQFCETLGGLPGRKALVYLSDGLPLRPADSLYEAWTGKYQRWVLENESDIRDSSHPEEVAVFARVMSSLASSEFDLGREIQILTVRANDSRVAFYPIAGNSLASSVSAAVAGGGSNAGSGSMMRNVATMEKLSRDASLLQLAGDTGGVAMTDSFDLDELLSRVAGDFGSFYSLGYIPANSADERLADDDDGAHSRKEDFRKIEVKVARKGLVVRHGKGYFTKSWRDRLGSMTLASALFELKENPLEVRVEPLEQAASGDRIRVPLMLKVPFELIRLVHRGRHYVAHLTALVVVQEEDGGLSEPIRVDFPIRIPDDRILEALVQDAGYVIELEVDKGTTRVALGVRDHIGGTESTVNLEFVAGEGVGT